MFTQGIGSPGAIAIPGDGDARWTVSPDMDGTGGLITQLVQGVRGTHREYDVTVRTCPAVGCYPPPPPPSPPPPDDNFVSWSANSTWSNLTGHVANPLNLVQYQVQRDGSVRAVLVRGQEWSAPVPSAHDNVWIPSWKKVVLDVDTPLLGHVVVEGVLLINGTASVNLSATYLEVCIHSLF